MMCGRRGSFITSWKEGAGESKHIHPGPIDVDHSDLFQNSEDLSQFYETLPVCRIASTGKSQRDGPVCHMQVHLQEGVAATLAAAGLGGAFPHSFCGAYLVELPQ
jgi:hypothetical protein